MVEQNTLNMYAEAVVVYADNVTEANVEAVMKYRQRSGINDRLTQPYDAVIRGTGWKHNMTVYHPTARPLMQSNRKFPRMNADYESVNVPGMYFAGTYSHGKDLKRGVTSVIKGFRYTARALFRILSEKHFGEDMWNSKTFCMPRQQAELSAHANGRMNEAAAPYLVFYSLGDGVIFEPNETGDDENGGCVMTAKYQEEVPIDHFTERFGHLHRMWWSFGFDGQPRDLDYVMNHGTGFEPWFWYFSPDDKVVEDGAGTKAPAGPARAELQAMKVRELLKLAQDPVSTRAVTLLVPRNCVAVVCDLIVNWVRRRSRSRPKLWTRRSKMMSPSKPSSSLSLRNGRRSSTQSRRRMTQTRPRG